MLGPALLKFGSEELKLAAPAKNCPRRDSLVPGLQRTGHGSDLAGLQTRAEDEGDHYIVDGQKVWTSYANKADWMFCLVRTDTAAKKHGHQHGAVRHGAKGVSTRPIKLITGRRRSVKPFWTT